MAEVVRTIEARIEIDTNKRTLTYDFGANSLSDLRDRLLDALEDIDYDLS